MILPAERQNVMAIVSEFESYGLSRFQICKEIGITLRTVQRWQRKVGYGRDGRTTASKPIAKNQLSEEERSEVLKVCLEPEFASLPPAQIVPRLADRGVYLASESTIYRLLKRNSLQVHRGRSKPRQVRPKASHCAKAPCKVWTWDITWLRGPVRGSFYYLYLVLDIYSRKVVAWEVHEQECSQNAATLIRRAVLREGLLRGPLVLHADNGGPQRGSTLRQTLVDLGIEPSYSRPRVSNDNPYSEAIFRTCKYRPAYPERGFKSLESARKWVLGFVNWYNTEHKHSGIKFVTPEQKHNRQDDAILATRAQVYANARARNPARWTRNTRNWEPTAEVWLNPVKDKNSSRTEQAEN